MRELSNHCIGTCYYLRVPIFCLCASRERYKSRYSRLVGTADRDRAPDSHISSQQEYGDGSYRWYCEVVLAGKRLWFPPATRWSRRLRPSHLDRREWVQGPVRGRRGREIGRASCRERGGGGGGGGARQWRG